MDSIDFTRIAGTQLWQLTALIAAVLVLVRLLGRNRPHFAHTLWLVVLLKCLTPPMWTSPSGVFCWVKGAIAPEAASPERREVEIDRIEAPLGELPAPTFDVHPASEDLIVESIAPRPSLVWPTVGALWLFGAVAVAATATWRWRQACVEIGPHRVDYDPAFDELLTRLARRLRLKRRVRLMVTASRVGPAVVGLFRPVIVLPEVIVRGKQPADLEPILAHELVHVRRGDLWIGLLQTIAGACWWFHPLVWLANRLIAREAERCCDEEVIGELGCEPGRYARCLLDVLELKRTLKPVPAFPGVRPVEVTSQRLERIMKLGQGCRKRTPWWCWLVLLLGAAIVLPGAALAVAENEAERTNSEAEGEAIQAITPPAPDAKASEQNEGIAHESTIPREYIERLEAHGVKVEILRPVVVESLPRQIHLVGERLSLEYRLSEDRTIRFEARSGKFTLPPESANSKPIRIDLLGEVRMKDHDDLIAESGWLQMNVSPDRTFELRFHEKVKLSSETFSALAEAATFEANRLTLWGDVQLTRQTDKKTKAVETLRAQEAVLEMRGGLVCAEGDIEIDPHNNVNLFQKTYRVADVVLPSYDPVKVTPSKPGDETADLKPVAAKVDFKRLIEAITTTIAPESWESAGGPGAIQGFDTAAVLVVSQTGGVHEHIADLLRQFRAIQNVQVPLEVHALRVTDDRFFERIGLDFDLELEDGAPTGFTRLSKRQADFLIEAGQGDLRVSIAKAPKITLLNGQAAELDLSLFGKSASTASGESLQLTPVIRTDHRTVRLNVALVDKDAAKAPTNSRAISIDDGQSLLVDSTAFARRDAPAEAKERLLFLITPKIVIADQEERK